MASKSETKKPDVQVGNELDQLAQAAEEAALKEAGVGANPAGETAPEGMGETETAKEYPPIVRKQANRLLRLFQLPPGHEGRAERIAEYQVALARNGVNPPADEEQTRALIREVGEYHG